MNFLRYKIYLPLLCLFKGHQWWCARIVGTNPQQYFGWCMRCVGFYDGLKPCGMCDNGCEYYESLFQEGTE